MKIIHKRKFLLCVVLSVEFSGTASPLCFQYLVILYDGFGGLVVSMLVSGTQVRGFKPGRSRWIFRA